jgi:mono/diheme cytochrome c family protein
MRRTISTSGTLLRAAIAAAMMLGIASSATAEDPAAEAAGIFSMRCATCHGASGAGDGAAAVALDPKPRSFADAEWQKSVTDEHIDKITVGGGTAVGMSPLMPPNPDLASKPDVVTALREIVRGFAK